MGKIISILMLVSMYALFVKAELDGPSKEALQKTQEAMLDPKKRSEAFAENPQYKEGEKAADHLFQGDEEQKQKTYEIAAKVLSNVAESANGDPEKMRKIVTQAQKNPEQFMEDYFSKTEQQKVRALASELEKQKKVAVPPQQPNH